MTSGQFPDFPWLPPPKKEYPQVDAAEFSALRIIVMTLIGLEAYKQEELGHGSAQSFINLIGELSSESVIGADI
jgi:hypothetical protein